MTDINELREKVRFTAEMQHSMWGLKAYMDEAWRDNHPEGLTMGHLMTLAAALWSDGVEIPIPSAFLEFEDTSVFDVPTSRDAARAALMVDMTLESFFEDEEES